MPRKPNVAALIGDTFKDAERGTPKTQALRTVLRDENAARVLLVSIEQIEPNPDQPRKHFEPAALRELADSVKEKGILQPIIVHRKAGDLERCIIIAGERRWRAAKAAGLREVPVLVRTPEDAREVAIIENLQRENLNAVEEAEALFALKHERSYTDAQLAKIVGKSRQAVNDSLLLNNLPDAIKDQCRMSGTWSKSQLLQVLRAGSAEQIASAFRTLKTGDGATVRELRKQKQRTAPPKRGRPTHYRFEYTPRSRRFTVTVTFAKRSVSRAELRAALKDGLNHLP